jgi:hypothetical protein
MDIPCGVEEPTSISAKNLRMISEERAERGPDLICLTQRLL